MSRNKYIYQFSYSRCNQLLPTFIDTMGNTGFLKKSSRILSLKCRHAYAFSFKNTRAKEKPKTPLFLDNIQNTDQVG